MKKVSVIRIFVYTLIAVLLCASFSFAADTWEDVNSWPATITPIIDNFKTEISLLPLPESTGLTSEDYLDTLELVADYFKLRQDPETGYNGGAGGTVCFAQIAAIVAVKKGRWDLLEPAAKAIDWAANDMGLDGTQDHSDFQATRCINAIQIVEPYVDPQRVAGWYADFASYNPYDTYAYALGGSNWNMIALAGEMKLYHLGVRNNYNYVEDSVEAQGYRFTSKYGIYEDPTPTSAYDLFARIWVDDILTSSWGYEGARHLELKEVLRRGSLTSLLAQSPSGQFPAGSRRTPFHFPDAAQAAIFEMYANKVAQDGDMVLAGIYKRAARRTLAMLQKWLVPGAEGIITKNLFPSSEWFGLEDVGDGYNLTMGSILTLAYQHSLANESITEQWTPAEKGTYAIKLENPFGRIFANAGGMYIQIEGESNASFDPTGLMRVHKLGWHYELGPSDGLLSSSTYKVPSGSTRTTAAVGPAWKDNTGTWRRLAEYPDSSISSTELQNIVQSTNLISFDVLYTGSFHDISQVRESYVITPENVQVTSQPVGYTGPVRFYWPILADNGGYQSSVAIDNSIVTWKMDGGSLHTGFQAYKAINPTNIFVSDQLYPNRSGWNWLAYAEFDDTAQMILAYDFKGDFNRDSTVDYGDLVVMTDSWLGNDPNVDIYSDGIIDFRDFSPLASNWIGPDSDSPTPDPMTWENPPAAASHSIIEMTATTASDQSGVEYYFENLTDPNHNSSWQSSPYYIDTELESETQYTYRVKARDLSVSNNQTGWSGNASATTGAFVHTTVFETFDADPTSNGWVNAQAGSTSFAYNATGYLDATVYRDSLNPARYYKQIPSYDKTVEFWWEFDCQLNPSSDDWGRALIGAFNSTASNYEFVGSRFATVTKNNRYDMWYQTPSSVYTLFIGPEEPIPDNANIRVKGHYWYEDGIGYAQMDVYYITSGYYYGSTGTQPVVPETSAFTFDRFALGNRTDGATAGPTIIKIDNMYFSTQQPNQSPVPPSF